MRGADSLILAGILLIIAGVALWSVAAALIVAGLCCIGIGGARYAAE